MCIIHVSLIVFLQYVMFLFNLYTNIWRPKIPASNTHNTQQCAIYSRPTHTLICKMYECFGKAFAPPPWKNFCGRPCAEGAKLLLLKARSPSRLGGLGSLVSSPAGSEAEPQKPKRF